MRKAFFLSLIELLLCQFGLLGGAEPNSPVNQLDLGPRARAHWFEEALKQVEHGTAGQQFLVGYNYYISNGVEQDYEQAFKWYSKAADQGDASARSLLGMIRISVSCWAWVAWLYVRNQLCIDKQQIWTM